LRVGYEIRLERVLRSAEEKIFGEKLGEWWGERHEESGAVYRTSSMLLCAESWEELRAVVNKEIESVVETLKKVKEKNLEMERTKPDDLEIVYEI